MGTGRRLRDRLSVAVRDEVESLAKISRELRRDLELAFYGAEDLTPSDFYSRDDAERECAGAQRTVDIVRPHVLTDQDRQ